MLPTIQKIIDRGDTLVIRKSAGPNGTMAPSCEILDENNKSLVIITHKEFQEAFIHACTLWEINREGVVNELGGKGEN